MSNGQADFFRNMLPYARRVSELTGIDPRLVLAQSALETGYGRSAPNFNFFGIKAPQGQGASLMTSEFENGQMVSRNEPFRTYESPAGSFQDYANLMLRAPRYRPVLEARTLEDQIAAMAASGYATDPEYGSKLSQIASGINLDDPGLIASDAMTAIGRGPDVSGMTATARPRPAMNGQPTTPGLLAQGVAPERPRRDIGNILDQLAVGFAGMSLRPNQGVVQMAQQRIGQRQEQQQTQRERNATAEWLRSQGRSDLADGVLNGGISGAQALAIMQRDATGSAVPANFRSLQLQAEQAGLEPGTPEYQQFMLYGGAARDTTPAAFAALDRQAQAAGLEPGTAEYQNFMLTRGAGEVVRSQLQTEIELGGTAAATEASGKAQIERANEAFDQAAGVQNNISNINEAIAAIDAGARSGLVENFFPSITEASASLENAMNRMGLDVIGSVTFGALSEGEMRLAMETAVPRNLDPAQLRDYLVRKREAQIKARDALMRAANYLARPGNTLEGWFAQRQQEMIGETTGGPSGSTRMRFDAEGNLIND
jgi:hypothetical protein